ASPYMAVFNAVIGPTTAAAAILGGWLAAACGQWEFSISGASFGGLHLLFMISCVGRLTSVILLWRVTEPRSHEIGRVVRILQRRFVRKPSALAPITLGWRGVMAARSQISFAGRTLDSAGNSRPASFTGGTAPAAGSTSISLSTDDEPASIRPTGLLGGHSSLADPLAA
ncbi:MAG TPA: hypothetical protein VHB99_09590, partial [Pirellulales bacterium]|nr:hypothetical protein [Pirellulales bacterium]